MVIALTVAVVSATISCARTSSSNPAADNRSAGEPAILEKYEVPVINLHGSNVTPPNELGNPTAIARLAKNLAVLDKNASGATLLVVDPVGGNVEASLSSRADSQIVGAWSIEPATAERTGFWVYDSGKRQFHLVQVLGGSKRLKRAKTIQLKSDALLTNPRWTSNGEIISPGFFRSGRVQRFDSAGTPIATVGTVPESSVRAPAAEVQHAYQSTLASNPAKTLFAIATRYADRVDIITLQPTSFAPVQRVFDFNPTFKIVQTGRDTMIDLSQTRFGYVDVTADDAHVFGLFSGRLPKNFPGRANYGQYLHVYDWHGTLVGVAKLDHDAIGITVDPSTSSLFAIGGPPDPRILRYDLSVLLNAGIAKTTQSSKQLPPTTNSYEKRPSQ